LGSVREALDSAPPKWSVFHCYWAEALFIFDKEVEALYKRELGSETFVREYKREVGSATLVRVTCTAKHTIPRQHALSIFCLDI
jgi:hypothetical protein